MSDVKCLEAALLYAARGWQVFPVGSGRTKKEPYTKNGLHDATTDEATIRGWWRKWPKANVGIRTGAASRLAVLDLDAKDIPIDILMAECERLAGAPFPRTAMSRTGGGGMHLLFQLEEGETVPNTTGSIAKNVDTRGEGGYIVAPPSLHASGNEYAWVEADGDTGLESEVAPAPAGWLLRLVAAVGTPQRAERVRNDDLGDVSWVPAALHSLDASMPYADWFRIGMSLRDVPDGRTLFLDWSATSPKFDQESAEVQWRRIQENPKSFIGLGTLWHAATQAGWRPSKRERNALPEPPALDDGYLESLLADGGPAEAVRTVKRSVGLPDDYAIDDAGRLVRVTVQKGRDGKEVEKLVLVSDPPFFITRRIHEVTMGVESLQAEWDDCGRRRVQVESRKVFCNASALMGCLDNGIPITSANAAEAVRYISACEAMLRRDGVQESTSRVLGWHGEGFLLGEERLNGAPSYLKLDETGGKAVSQVHQTGDAEVWARAMVPALLEHDTLRALVASAVASPLLPFLGETARPFFMDLCGETGCGKTQMMQVALSCIGNPMELATTFSSTPIAIMSYVSMFAHHTVAIDETKNWSQKSGAEGLKSLIYQLSSGRGRDRGTISVGKFQRTEEFKSIMITTSEFPLSSVTGDGGLRSRCVTLHGFPWGEQSPVMAAKIAELLGTVSMNFGHAQRAMVERLLAMTPTQRKTLRTRWKGYQEAATARSLRLSPGNKVAARLAGYMATLELAWSLLSEIIAEWAGDALPYEWSELLVTTDDLWSKVLYAGASADRPLAALEYLAGLVALEPDRFAGVGAKNAEMPNGGWYGVTHTQDGTVVELGMVMSKVRELLKRGEFDAEGCFQAWKQREWLETDQKRLDKKMMVAGVRTRCLTFSRKALSQVAGYDLGNLRVVHDVEDDAG